MASLFTHSTVPGQENLPVSSGTRISSLLDKVQRRGYRAALPGRMRSRCAIRVRVDCTFGFRAAGGNANHYIGTEDADELQ